MQEKIFDIIPIKEKKSTVFGGFINKKEKSVNNVNNLKNKPKRKFFVFLISLFFLGILIIFLWFNFFITKAQILIYPQKDNIQFSEDIIFDTRVEKSDFEKKVIQGKIVEIEKNVFEEFKPTSTLKKKAEGVIRLYNAFSTNAETWVKGTRFVSSGGKLFLSKDKILVPGAKIENGKLAPSFVDVPVIAAEEGEEYNIEPSSFSVSAFLGTPRYTAFYGKSSEPMKGGGSVLFVQEKDLELAKNTLIDRVKKEGEKDLSDKIEKELILIPNSLTVDVLEATSSAENGQEIESFSMSLKAKVKGFAYKEKDLLDFINKKILLSGIDNKTINLNKINFKYEIRDLNINEGFIVSNVEAGVEIYQNIDIQSFVRNIAGKKIKEAKVFLDNYSDITKYVIDIFPFWKKSLPVNIEKIEVKVIVD
jgi:hypothetical protein